MGLKSHHDAIGEALDAGPRLLTSASKTCVIVPDATRPLPFEATLRQLFERLQGAEITCLVGLGLHRPMTVEELAPIQRAIGDRDIEILQHDARSPHLFFGGTTAGIPVALNRAVVQAERVICVGTVEPHQYAGYSGGIKAISIGCAGESTISAMHGLTFLRDERTTLGRIRDNPFQNALWDIGASIEEMLGLQLVPAAGGGIRGVFFGELRSAFQRAYEFAAESFFEVFDTPVDWLHLRVPAVKASNFYQASRAATYAALVDGPAVRPGGVILVEADCPEGLGEGVGERACAEAMKSGVHGLLQQLRGGEPIEIRGGQQRAYVLARACERNRIALIGAPVIDELSLMDIEQFDCVDEAADAFALEGAKGRRIDDIFHCIPTLTSPVFPR